MMRNVETLELLAKGNGQVHFTCSGKQIHLFRASLEDKAATGWVLETEGFEEELRFKDIEETIQWIKVLTNGIDNSIDILL